VKIVSIRLAVGALFALTLGVSAQDHGHLYIGAATNTPGFQASFPDRAALSSTSGFLKTLVFTNAGRYSNYFVGSFTLSAYARTLLHPEYSPSAAALGAFMHASIASVEGPPGGAFAFWESASNSPTISVPVGGTSTNLILVSQNGGTNGVDPFGHIHGRRFTATKQGLYTVRFKAWDISTNGPGGGPIHAPSDEIPIYFQAGFQAYIGRSNGIPRVTYGTFGGWDFQVQTTTNLFDTNSWSALGPLRTGDDYFFAQPDTNAVVRQRYFRVRVTPTPL
jgi:hypothetical protein